MRKSLMVNCAKGWLDQDELIRYENKAKKSQIYVKYAKQTQNFC